MHMPQQECFLSLCSKPWSDGRRSHLHRNVKPLAGWVPQIPGYFGTCPGPLGAAGGPGSYVPLVPLYLFPSPPLDQGLSFRAAPEACLGNPRGPCQIDLLRAGPSFCTVAAASGHPILLSVREWYITPPSCIFTSHPIAYQTFSYVSGSKQLVAWCSPTRDPSSSRSISDWLTYTLVSYLSTASLPPTIPIVH